MAKGADLTLALLTVPELSIHLAVRTGRTALGALSLEPEGVQWEGASGDEINFSWEEFAAALGGAADLSGDLTPVGAVPAAPVAKTASAAKKATKKTTKNAARKSTAKAPAKKAAKAPATKKGAGVDPAAVRAWARGRGMTVSDRGRLSADLVDAYRRANA